MRRPPYPTVLKPYGSALLELARARPEVVCLSADLTRQCEVDLFREAIPDRFFNIGMAEQNLMGIAGALARQGHIPFVHSFGVFCTRRAYDQVAMAIAYPCLPVRLVGFMPGLSSPGGPSHQAIDDLALMRALPNMTVLDLADATEIRQAVGAIVDLPGPAYLRLKRGEIPVIFDDGHRLDLHRAQLLQPGSDLAIVASGMMLPAALVAADALSASGLEVAILHTPVVKPLDVRTVVEVCAHVRGVVVAENHSIVGGLGSAVAEALAEAGCHCRLRRVGVPDTFAEAGSMPFLFERYGLSSRHLVAAAWSLLGRSDPPPSPPTVVTPPGQYAPV
ncbi:MAG TPA: transketolase C-terminal domain-containing protein [Candidatus Dormibacteraeota bacterium]|nr:transketolase C-terminal domain-containing protein [Candidatus Dormibacteraeota bacterium]